MKYLALILIAALALGACTPKKEKAFFDGKFYPTKAKRIKGDRKSFSVSVRKAGQGLDGAREAGRHGGTLYCLENYGTSEIIWSVGPDADEAMLVSGKGGSLILKGECHLW